MPSPKHAASPNVFKAAWPFVSSLTKGAKQLEATAEKAATAAQKSAKQLLMSLQLKKLYSAKGGRRTRTRRSKRRSKTRRTRRR